MRTKSNLRFSAEVRENVGLAGKLILIRRAAKYRAQIRAIRVRVYEYRDAGLERKAEKTIRRLSMWLRKHNV